MSSHARRMRAAIAVVGLALGALSAAVPLAAASTASPTAKAPFTDTNVNAWLTFCNQKDQPVTSGSIYAQPFVWKAISSGEAPPGYRGQAARGTLYAYQPIQYVDPLDWSGQQLTAGAVSSNAHHPVAAATAVDLPLIGFVQAYPPHWNGLVEIRMIYSAGDKELLETPYAAAVIRVSGKTWTLVEGGGGSCSQGQGISVEKAALPKKDLVVHPAAGSSATPAAGGSSSQSPVGASASGGTGSSGSNSASGSTARLAAADSSTGMGAGELAGIGGVVLVVVWAAITLIARRRRRPAS